MKVIQLLFLMVLVLVSAGCTKTIVSEVPLCAYAKPPTPKTYLDSNADTRLVLMTMSFTDALRKASECNANIVKVNAKNKLQ